MLGSRLQQWNLLQNDVRISLYRKRQRDLYHLFERKNNLVFCCDINDLMKNLNLKHDPTEWRLFAVSFKLHFGNRLASIPIGHAVHIKETYANMTTLDLIKSRRNLNPSEKSQTARGSKECPPSIHTYKTGINENSC